MSKISLKTLNTGNKNIMVFLFYDLSNGLRFACFPVRIRLGELLCYSHTIARTCVGWSWRLKEGFALVASLVNGLAMIHGLVLFQARWQCHVYEP